MGDVPSLFSLCSKAIERAIFHGCDNLHNIFELPSNLLECLLMDLSALALQMLHEELTSSELKSHNTERKRRRSIDLNGVWKILFNLRWSEHAKVSQHHSFTKSKDERETCEIIDWQQLYWEQHLQRCFDEASEMALLPSFSGCVNELKISDAIIKSIGCREDIGLMTSNYKKLSYHCQKFGCYARHLRLQNVLCIAETCELLRSSNLQDVVFCNIKSNVHVEGVCNLIRQKRHTLLSLKFLHCKLPSTALDEICESIGAEHVIQHLSFLSSSIFGYGPGSLSGFLCFISSERSLLSLKFCETQMGPTVAKSVFDALINSSSGLSTLEISDNNIAGWLSKSNIGPRCTFPPGLGSDSSLKSLQVLNLRGNNLGKDDVEDVKLALVHMPNLCYLDISDNPFTDDGIRSLLPYFSWSFEKPCPLSSIKMENCSLSSTGVAQLLMSLPSSKTTLNCLSIAENDLGRWMALPLANLLSTSSVKELNIEDIGLGPIGFLEFEENLPKNVDLVYLKMGKNRGGIGAARFVSKVILQASELVAIDAGHNFLPYESLEIIYTALKQSKGKLMELDLTGNSQLCQLSQNTSPLTSFHIHERPNIILPSTVPSAAPYDDDP